MEIYNAKNNIHDDNFKLQLGVCSMLLKLQLEIFIRSTISAMHKFQEKIMESLQNLSETRPQLTET